VWQLPRSIAVFCFEILGIELGLLDINSVAKQPITVVVALIRSTAVEEVPHERHQWPLFGTVLAVDGTL
jgi:hypothetical protein